MLCYDAPPDGPAHPGHDDRHLRRGAIGPAARQPAIEGERIAAVGGEEVAARFPDAEVVDGRGKAVFPGLINSHTHVWHTTGRGVQEDFGYPPIQLPGVSSTLAVSRSWVKGNPRLVESFLKALIQSTALTNADHDKSVAAIANHLPRATRPRTRPSWRTATQRYRGTFPNPPYVTRDQVRVGHGQHAQSRGQAAQA